MWACVTDQRTPHQSEGLVQLGAAHCGSTDDLGRKGASGSLPSMARRAAFLSDPTHRIQCVFVPKHTAWRNHVAIWCSILVRRVRKRGSFRSVAELRERILAFISSFNRTTQPFQWTYTGRP